MNLRLTRPAGRIDGALNAGVLALVRSRRRGRTLMLAGGALFGFAVGIVGFGAYQGASAYNYYYPDQYIRDDSSGSWSYRSLSFDWSAWNGSDETVISNVTMSTQISSPTAGYHYETWNLGFQSPYLNFYSRSSANLDPLWTLTYSSGINYIGFPDWGGNTLATSGEPIVPFSAVCGNDSAHQYCGFPSSALTYGALLQAKLPLYYTYIPNGWQQFPGYGW